LEDAGVEGRELPSAPPVAASRLSIAACTSHVPSLYTPAKAVRACGIEKPISMSCPRMCGGGEADLC
jgi:hypothetical protein